MKRIIDGKRYNTETATQIATWTNGHNYGDFYYCKEVLYRTAKGAFFLHGESGAVGKYSRSAGQNCSRPGQAITALSDSDARAWLEEHGKTAAIEEYFADAITDA